MFINDQGKRGKMKRCFKTKNIHIVHRKNRIKGKTKVKIKTDQTIIKTTPQ